MAWNEPGGGGNKNPWSGGGNNKNNSGPPDLDELWRRLRAKLTGGANGDRGSGGNGGSSGVSGALLGAIIAVIIVVWLLTGLYVVQPGEKGVVLRFGEYTHTSAPGWHWRVPYPVDSVYKVDTQKVRSASKRAVMLTTHENYVDVKVAVQYRVSNAMHYLFRLREPDMTVLHVLRAAVRSVVGNSSMNEVIQEGVDVQSLKQEADKKVDLKKEKQSSEPQESPMANLDDELVSKIKAQLKQQPKITNRSRATLHTNIKKLMQYRLDQYEAGIEIMSVNVKYAQPPEPVQNAFEEAIKAREQKVNKKNTARAYARALVARAQGEKAQTVAKAKAYKQRTVARSEGQAARFAKLESQYENAPNVTRDRLYLQTMSKVLGNSHVILNSGGQGSMNYLPLEQVLSEKTEAAKRQQSSDNESGSQNMAEPGDSPALPEPMTNGDHGSSNTNASSGNNGQQTNQSSDNSLRNRNRNR
ncbi:protease modulator HflK [Salinisphaera sp. USBA-960]|uniref:protease modulator HflK n=1 Tax=Salinisphaera orenii TaxID=856731 RepID=UPI000DBE86EA|nr:protease modulator HflK [Salifodinibacter halophilus]NNC26056.1 protease modulator HflK [Salifodinibacter halophilus]